MRRTVLGLAVLLSAAACEQLPTGTPQDPLASAAARTADPNSAAIQSLMAEMNQALATSEAAYRVHVADWLGGDAVGNTVFFRDVGNKQLGLDFVPGDTRRGGGAGISYIVDQAEGAIDGLTVATTTAAIDRAMGTWDAETCSTIPIESLPNIPGVDIGVVEFLSGLGGLPFAFADIVHAGWLPGGILPNQVIGVTFTFIFVEADGVTPTDVDGNGLLDVALREILYNDAFTWRINGNIDVESVALHESGHGLSQAHFGKLTQTLANGKFHFSPLAVMNAGYTGISQSLYGTDRAGHCSIWEDWPNS
jgi:hypothetical protein